MAQERVGIVGAGIVGLAHAWMAAERGHHVTVVERSPQASGASIRNFGMVWPIGQPAGELREIALRSRQLWMQLSKSANIWVKQCGSIHLAHHPDEWEVLQQFYEQSPLSFFECSLMTASQLCEKYSAANPVGLLGGLASPTELCVNPRMVIREMPNWLAREFGVRFEFHTTITNVDDGRIRSSDGRGWEFDRTVVCSGADFETLFPEVFAHSGLRVCKLQMLKTHVQSNGWRIGPHWATGLTLRHYHNFDACPSLAAVKERIAHESPELDQFGIHVMASQNDVGEVILGDSHEYDADIEPFDKTLVDDLILRELHKVLRLPDWRIAERWHGVYTKHPSAPAFVAEPLPNVHICTGTGGAGMTMSFGLAERNWQQWTNE